MVVVKDSTTKKNIELQLVQSGESVYLTDGNKAYSLLQFYQDAYSGKLKIKRISGFTAKYNPDYTIDSCGYVVVE